MKVLILGDKGPLVAAIQQRLNNAGYSVTVDGDFGKQTQQAVFSFQRDRHLVIDGIVGGKTCDALLNRHTRPLLRQKDIELAADQLGVDIATVFAVKNVESRGHGFLPDGRPVILYERHIMKKRLAANGFNRGRLSFLQEKFPNLVNSKTGGYGGGSVAHYRLNLAKDIHTPSALESCSWGLFQIMGYHWERLGYDSIDLYVTAMQQNEGNQLYAFVRFIETDAKLHQALRDQDWAGFARRYNGPGYKKNRYDTRLAKAYADYENLSAETWEAIA